KRVFLAHEHHHAATLARPEAGRLRVKDSHLVPGERAQSGEAGQFKGIQTKIDASRDGHIDITALERRAGGSDGEQAGGAGAVHGVAAALKVKVIADAAGNRVGKTAGQR